ncbi:MAG: substrate-binding domain-containing protein [Caldisphaera sp.]|nr:substrate-binding domain-containing protein [Caldisphaera sp.]PMP61068.1 MAG: molybdenum ABC transporter substrate-binding protein [Caldisphaera sp.]PMP88604.1 MAG: molybdenum ABC transporter substrate-binding protein [Caldisphaera sp.]
MAKIWTYLIAGLIVGLVIGIPLGYVVSPKPVSTTTTTTTQSQQVFTIGAAGTLKFAFGNLLNLTNKLYPGLSTGTPLFKGSGEVAQDEISTKEFSVVASADTTTIPADLFKNVTNYEIAFGVTQMVVIVDLQTQPGKEVYSLWKQVQTMEPLSQQWNQTWKQIFSIIALNPSTVVGVSNPFTDPSGYQAQCVLKLAGLTFFNNASYLYNSVYGNVNRYDMRNTEIDLLTLMATNNSVQFILSGYLSNAMPQTKSYQSQGINITYITLPPQINLGNLSYVNYYHNVNVTWTELGETKTFTCNPVVYTITIPEQAPNKNAAINFILLLFSPLGQQILQQYGINPIVPGIVYGNISSVPAQIRPFVIPVNQTNLASIFP